MLNMQVIHSWFKFSVTTIVFTILLLGCLSNTSFGQLSGVFQVYGEEADFPTMQSALDSLAEVGMAGAVDLLVSTGTHNERFTIPAIPGSSETNLLHIHPETPDSTLAVFSVTNSSNFNEPIVEFDNASFVRISYIGFAVNNGRMVGFNNVCNQIELSNCNFNAALINGSFSDANAYLFISIRADLNELESLSNLSIKNSRFYGNARHLFFRGTSNNQINHILIEGCEFSAFTFQCSEFERVQDLDFRKCIITGRSQSSSTSVHSLELVSCQSPLNIECNKFTNDHTTGFLYQLILTACLGESENHIRIQNNFFTNTNSVIQFNNSAYIDFFHNNINTQNGGSQNGSNCILIQGETDHINLVNNIIRILSGVVRYIEYNIPNVEATINSDYNVFWKASIVPSYFRWSQAYGSTNHTLEAWGSISGMETHSFLLDPEYVSLTDLHVNPELSGLSGTALPLLVAYDIDNESRSLTLPDRGADEFSNEVEGISDFAVLDVLSRNPETCVLTDSILVLVANYSQVLPYDLITYELTINGEPLGTIESDLTILPGDSAVINLGAYDFIGYGETDILIQATLPPELFDLFIENNSLNYLLLNAENLEIQDPIAEYCPEDNSSKQLLIYEASFPSITWSTGESSSSIQVADPGIYTVTVSDEKGCLHTASIEVTLD